MGSSLHVTLGTAGKPHPAARQIAPQGPRLALVMVLLVPALTSPLTGCSSRGQPPPHPPIAAKTVGVLLNEPEALGGYTLFNRRVSTTIHLIDDRGSEVHRWELGAGARVLFARLLENGNLLTVPYHSKTPRHVTEVDRDGKAVWTCSQGRTHHDALKMPNGNVLLLSQQRKTVREAIAAGADPDFIPADGLVVPHVVEAKPVEWAAANCEVVWEWSAWDHLIQDFDPGKANHGVVAEHPELIDVNFRLSSTTPSDLDWAHANGLDYNPDLDQIVLSPRHFSEVWIIDHSTTTAEAASHGGGRSGKGGDLLYRWGNPQAYRAGTPDDQRLFWQHNPQWIAPGLPGAGNILIFNNGHESGDFSRDYSSVDEIAPPVDGANYRLTPGSAYSPVEPVWVYTAPTPSDFFAEFISGAQRLPNGNTFICDGPRGTLFEVTPSGRTVWKYVNPLTKNGPLHQGESVPDPSDAHETVNQVYRAYRYAPDHPGLQGLDLTPGEPIELYSAE